MEKTEKTEDMIPVYNFDHNNVSIHLSLGNTKIGRMINWSTLPGNDENRMIAVGKLLTDVAGTCSSNCTACFKNCYARKSGLQHHNSVIRPWAENTIMIREHTDECFKQIDDEIGRLNRGYKLGKMEKPVYEYFRINVSGEISSAEELIRWNDLALKHPEIKFGTYTKNSQAVIGFFQAVGQSAPNFTINISEWHGVMTDTIAKLHAMGAIFNVFEYDDSNLSHHGLSGAEVERLAKLPHCPAVGATKENRHPKNPKTGEAWHCDECKGCYTKTGTHRCVYSH